MKSIDQFFGISEEITLTKNGVWLSNGQEIEHLGTLRAFSKNIYRSKDGYYLQIGNEQKTIQVEDTFLFIQSLSGTPEEGYELLLNDERRLKLDPSTLTYSPGRLVCQVPDTKTGLLEEARFLSSAYHELLKQFTQVDDHCSMTIQGHLIILPLFLDQ